MARTQSAGKILPRHPLLAPDPPVALTLAGSDCCAGAGIQADLKTFTALGVYGLTTLTAVVAETPGQVVHIEPLTPHLVQAQASLLFQTYPVLAAKTGMLPNAEIVSAVAHVLTTWKRATPHARLVVDPILTASAAQQALITPEGTSSLQDTLFPLADLITPNLPEARALLENPTDVSPRALAETLAARTQTSVLLKGGHHQGDSAHAIDLLVTPSGITEFSSPRIPEGHRLHGTGCTLSAAITAELAKGAALEDAVAAAKAHVSACIQSALHWEGVSALGWGKGRES